MKIIHDKEKLQKDLDMFGVLWKQLEERTAKVAARSTGKGDQILSQARKGHTVVA